MTTNDIRTAAPIAANDDTEAARNEYIKANPYRGGSKTAYYNKMKRAIEAMIAARVR